MRNLKKALSLALASVMVLGMTVVGSNAAFKDVDANDHQEAIDVMQLIDVMVGDQNGNFNPDQKVTRNEMAVVIAKMMNLPLGGNHPFKDVPAWADKYVAALYNNGITSGTSATTYGGNNNVTTKEAGLMMMKTLGYFVFDGEYGDDWGLATIRQANKINLFEDMGVFADQQLTRNDVALLALNTLESDVVVAEELGGMDVSGNGIHVNQKPVYIYNRVDNDKDYAGRADGNQQLAEKLYPNKKLQKTEAVAADNFGRPATQWQFNTEIVKSAKAPDLVYTEGVKAKDVKKALGNLKDYNVVAYHVNGKSESAPTDENKFGGNGVVTEVYFDLQTAEAEVVSYNNFVVEAKANYSVGNEELSVAVKAAGTFNKGETLKAEDFEIVKTAKKDDLFLATAYTTDGTNYTIDTLAPAEVVSNVKLSAKDKDYVVADGTKYKYAKNMSTMVESDLNLQSTKYDLVLDPNGYVVAIKAHDSALDLSNYVFIEDAEKYAFDVNAKAVFMDGTKKVITVSKVGGADATEGNVDKAKFYTFETNKDGEYELTAVAADRQKDVDTVKYDKNKVNPTNVVGLVANDVTVFIAKDKVTTGLTNAPEVKEGDIYALLDEDKTTILAVYAVKEGVNATEKSELVYVIEANGEGKDADGNKYQIVTVLKDGKKVDINVTSGSTTTAGLYEIKNEVNGYAELTPCTFSGTKFEKVDSVAQDKMKYEKGVATIGDKNYAATKDTVVYVYDGDAVKTVTVDELGNQATASYTVYVVKTADDTVIADTIFVIK